MAFMDGKNKMEYYTQKILRFRVYTKFKDRENWSLSWSFDNLEDAEETKDEFSKDDLLDAKVVDAGKETFVKTALMP